MNKEKKFLNLFRSKKTVFTFKDIALILREDNSENLRKRVNYYVKKGDLYKIRKGIYAKDKNYDKFELATRIYTPAYVSFETVSGLEGLTFQYYSQIFVASYLTREIQADNQKYSFRKIKDAVLTNKTGIENKGEYMIASKERAFLDIMYINKDYYFDNLIGIDWDKVFKILPIYNNKRMTKKIKEIFINFKNQK